MKNKYFKILGLRPGASQDEIKKAYRLSALKYHPDKNEGDAEKFLLISEAYEFLIENEQNENTDSEYEYYAKKASNSSIKRGKNNYSPEEFEQRLQWAKEKYQEKRYQEYVDDDRFYKSLTTGWKFKYFYFLTGICILVSMVFLADNTMETKTVNSTINYKDNTGEVAVPSRDLFYIEIDNQSVFIRSKDFPTLYSTTKVVTKKTPIFNEIVAIETKDVFGEDKTILPQFSISSTFPLVTLILLAPLLVLIFKRRTPLFIFLFLTCSFLFPIIIVILFSVNNRFFALLN